MGPDNAEDSELDPLPTDPLVDGDLPRVPGGEADTPDTVPQVLDPATEEVESLIAFGCSTCFSTFMLPVMTAEEIRARAEVAPLCPYAAQHEAFQKVYQDCKRSKP